MRDAIRTFPCRSGNYELLGRFDGSFTGEWKEYRNVTGVKAINPSKVFGRSLSQAYLLKSSKFTVHSCLPTQLIHLSKLKFWRIIMDGAARRRLNLTLPMMPHAFLKFYLCVPGRWRKLERSVETWSNLWKTIHWSSIIQHPRKDDQFLNGSNMLYPIQWCETMDNMKTGSEAIVVGN